MSSKADRTAILEARGAQFEADIAAIVQRFDELWQPGSSPNLREFLAEISAVHVQHAFAKLLAIELDQKVSRCELPDLAAYKKSFPDHADAIANQFEQRTLEQYFLGRQLGSGGMGCVHSALHTLLKRRVAVKTLFPSQAHNAISKARFEREMRSAGQLDHPHIVRTVHAGEHRGTYFLVMELIEGPNLAQLLAARGALSVSDACELACQAASALSCVQAHGLVHRDLKPGNLMLTREGTLKLLDLGLARLPEADDLRELTKSETGLGTLDYMAPEQCRCAKSCDIRADIYSLGCTLFHFLAGQPPYAGPRFSSAFEKMNAHISAPVPAICSQVPRVPVEAGRVVCRMMAKDPAARYQSPAEVLEALKSFSAGSDLRQLFISTVKVACAPAPATEVNLARSASTFVHDRNCSADKKHLSRENAPLLGRREWIAIALAGAVGGSFALNAILNRLHATKLTPYDNIAALPGLNGDWWFDTIPWYLPAVREQTRALWSPQVAKRSSTRGLLPLETQTDIETLLQNAAIEPLENKLRECSPVCFEALSTDAKFLTSVCRNVDLDVATPENLCRGLETVHEDLAKRMNLPVRRDEPLGPHFKQVSASDCHLLGLVAHKLSKIVPIADTEGQQIDGNTKLHVGKSHGAFTRDELYRLAEGAYKAAETKYDLAWRAGDPQLLDLCRSDLGQLYFDKGEMGDAEDYFKLAGDQTASALLRIWCRCAQASACWENFHWERALQNLREAEDIARQQLNLNHPMQAHVQERLGWYFERASWFYDRQDYAVQAKTHFQAAVSIRTVNLQTDPRVARDLFHDRLALAMVDQLRGDGATAKKEFSTLVADIDQSLGQPHGNILRLKLLERKCNTLERQADCVLCSAPMNFIEATRLYAHAVEFARQEFVKGNQKSTVVCQLLCKQRIAAALAQEFASVDQAQSALNGFVRQNPLSAADQQQLAIMRAIADAAGDWAVHGGEPATVVVPIREAIEARSRQTNHDEGPKLKRDEKLVLNLLFLQVKPPVETWETCGLTKPD